MPLRPRFFGIGYATDAARAELAAWLSGDAMRSLIEDAFLRPDQDEETLQIFDRARFILPKVDAAAFPDHTRIDR